MNKWILGHCYCGHVVTKESCLCLAFTCRSPKILLGHIASHLILLNVTYSVFACDSATVVCFFEDQDIALVPNRNTYPIPPLISVIYVACQIVVYISDKPWFSLFHMKVHNSCVHLYIIKYFYPVLKVLWLSYLWILEDTDRMNYIWSSVNEID